MFCCSARNWEGVTSACFSVWPFLNSAAQGIGQSLRLNYFSSASALHLKCWHLAAVHGKEAPCSRFSASGTKHRLPSSPAWAKRGDGASVWAVDVLLKYFRQCKYTSHFIQIGSHRPAHNNSRWDVHSKTAVRQYSLCIDVTSTGRTGWQYVATWLTLLTVTGSKTNNICVIL